MGFKVRRIDKGKRRIVAQLRRLNRSGVKMGFPAERPEGDIQRAEGVRNVDLAVWFEFGTETMPERSHFRSTFREKRTENKIFMSRLIRSIYRGTLTTDQALDRLGLKGVSDIRAKIRSNIPPPLVSRQGTALIDTAQYINAINYVKSRK